MVISLISAVVVTRAAEPARVQSIRIATHSVLPQASVGKDYSFQFRSAGKSEPLEWKLFTPVPGRWDWDGWKLEPGGRLSGKISGADCDASGGGCPESWICGPAKRCEGIVSFYVSASNLKGEYEQRVFDLVVTDPANPLEVGNFPTLTAGAVGQAYEAQFYARGGSAPFSWKTTRDSLPPGLSLGTDGVLIGTPTAAGSFNWIVEVTDSSSKKATKKVNLRIDNLSEPIVFTPNPKAVIQSTTPRIGLNVGDFYDYYNDVKLYNQYIDNPGLEPRPPMRRMYWAWAGSTNTLEEHYYARFLELEELNSGFWDGGRYWILSGPAKGREGRIAKYERVPDKNVEGGYRAVWTLSDSDRSRIIKKTPASEFEKDIFMVESLPRNITDPKNFRGTAAPGWSILGDEGATFSVDKVRPPGGTQSAKIVSTNDVKVGLSSAIIWENPWRRLRSDTTYTFSLDVRQSSVEDGTVTVQLAEPFWTVEPFFVKNFHIPDDGKFHRISGEFTGKGHGAAGFQVILERKGTLWVDNALLYESLATKSAASEPRQASVRAKPFEPLPFVVDDLQKLKAGSLRFWYHDTWLPLDYALTAAMETTPGPSHNIFSNLRLAEMTRSRAWIITAKEWLPSEFAQLAEYLSSKDITTGLGKLRAEQGHPRPWTDTLERIYIEYQDEAWNWPQWAYPFDLWHPNKYASFAKERFNAFRASKYYSPKVVLVANGQLADDYWVNDPVDKLIYPAHDAMDIAPYVDTFGSVPLNELSATVLGEVTGFAKTMQDTMKIWSSRGEKTRMLIYEGGPGAEGYQPPAGSEVRKNSMTLASLSIDSMADLFAHGAEEYHQTGYQGNVAWQATTGSTSRFRLPIWYGISMFNSACADRAMVETKVPAGVPSLKTISQDGEGKRIDGKAVPAISVRSYVKSGRKSFLVINRNSLVEYPVILRTMDTNVSYRVTTLAAAKAEKGTLEGLGLLPTDMAQRDLSKIVETVQPAVMEVKSAGGGVRIVVPPASIITIQSVP